MNIRPLNDRILVKRKAAAGKSSGGLFLPESASDKPSEGVVLAVGEGKVLEDGTVRPLQVKEGDTVVFGKYAGTEVQIDGEERIVLREDEVFGILG